VSWSGPGFAKERVQAAALGRLQPPM